MGSGAYRVSQIEGGLPGWLARSGGVTRHGRRVRAPQGWVYGVLPSGQAIPAAHPMAVIVPRYSPSTSIIEYRPGGRPATQRAAAIAPRANPERSWAWCASSICSPGPAKKTR